MSKSEYLKLIEEVRKHDRHYFIENHPAISDYEYDQLYAKLKKIEAEHPEWVTPTSPTQRVGEALTKGFRHGTHTTPMLSLDNTYNPEELGDYVARVHRLLEKEKVPFCVELKMDGVAVSVRYEKGKYTRALTRGDGRVGDDITANMKTIRSIPLEIPYEGDLEIRGEVFMPHRAFQKQNEEKEEAGEEPWANPRNAAAGSLKLLDPHEVAQRGLQAVFYGIAERENPPVPTQHAVHEYLHQFDLPVFSTRHRAVCDSVDSILKFAHKIEKERETLPFDIDGIVIKVDPLKYWPLLGTTGKSPRWAVAYKFAPLQATTRIREIRVQVGRTGILTPVAELEPVFLAGSTISRATLHNEREVARKDIREGDYVVIAKGGDVIPQVIEVDKKRRPSHTHPWKMPSHCPVCATPVVRLEKEVAVRCPNRECPAQTVGRLIHFTGKHGMDINHLGEKVAEQLVEKKLIKKPSDIYTLTADDLAKLEGFKEKSIQNLLHGIDASRHVSLARLICALGIPHVGEETAELLAQEAGSIHQLAKMTQDDLLRIEGIGEKMAEAIKSYFQDPKNLKEIEALLAHGVKPEPPKQITRTGHLFSGKTFVLTGALQNYSRDQAAQLIKERGGKVSSSVSKNTDFVLVGEDPGSKLDKAKELKIPTLTEKQFESLL